MTQLPRGGAAAQINGAYALAITPMLLTTRRWTSRSRRRPPTGCNTANLDGKLKEDFSSGNSFDRYKWSGRLYRTLTEMPAIASLWSLLMELYSIYASPFMRDRGFPEEVSKALFTVISPFILAVINPSLLAVINPSLTSYPVQLCRPTT